MLAIPCGVGLGFHLISIYDAANVVLDSHASYFRPGHF
jgi:hypothetical protein